MHRRGIIAPTGGMRTATSQPRMRALFPWGRDGDLSENVKPEHVEELLQSKKLLDDNDADRTMMNATPEARESA